MEPCKACEGSHVFQLLSTPLYTPSVTQQQSGSSDLPLHLRRRDSKLVSNAFGLEQVGSATNRGLADLPVHTADLKLEEKEPKLEILETATTYGFQQPSCLALGLRNGIRGAVVGTAFGGAMALSTAVQSGYRGTAAASYAGMGAMRNAAAFGSWTGLYGVSRCGLARMRRRNDLLNPTVAGAFTGGVLTLISTRGYWRYNQSTILVNAAGSAMVAVMFEALSYM